MERKPAMTPRSTAALAEVARLLLLVALPLASTSRSSALPAGPTTVQSAPRFDPQEHLPGYLEAYFSDYSDLYDFTPFQALADQRLAPSQLESARQSWANEQKRAAARIAELQADPRARFLHETTRRLERRQFFRGTELRRIDTFAPYYFYVEPPSRREEGFEERFAHLVAPWVQKLGQVFERTYVQPLGLTRNPRAGAFGIVVLASRGRYDDYGRAVREPGLHWSEAHYDPDLRLAITFRDEGSYARAAENIRHALLHELVHAMQHAYAPDEIPQETWLVEGMAEYLSAFAGDSPDGLDAHPPDRDALQLVAPLTGPDVRELLLPTLAELVTCEGYGGVVGLVRKKLVAKGLDAPGEFILGLHYAHASLLVHFLHEAGEGRYRDALRRYYARSLERKGGAEGLKAAFEGVDPARLEEEFVAHVRRLYGEAFPGQALPSLEDARAAVPVASAAQVSFDPGLLAPDPADAENALAEALTTARRGAVVQAAARLREWLALGKEHALAERIRTELVRLDAFAAERRRFFEHVAAGGKKLDLVLPEGRLLSPVEGLEGETVRLGTNRLKVRTLDLERMDLVTCADLMRTRKYGFLGHWVHAYPYALTGATQGKVGLFDGSEESSRLERDAAEDYPRHLGHGAVLAELAAVAAEVAAPGSVPAESTLQRLSQLTTRHRADRAVAARLDALQLAARAVLEADFDRRPLGELLRGEVSEGAGGELTIRYDFDDPAQLEDFVPVDGPYAFQDYDAAALPPRGAFAIDAGRLRGSGLATLRHIVWLERPSLSYVLAIENREATDSMLFLAAVADDTYGSMLAVRTLGTLRLFDKRSRSQLVQPSALQTAFLGQSYTVRLSNDGQVCQSSVDGQITARAPSAPRPAGYSLVGTAMQRALYVDQLTVSGRLDDGARAGLRATWVSRELERRGLSAR